MLLENNLRGIQHIGIPTLNIDNTIAWYQSKLGFEFAGETRIPTPEGDIRITFVERDGLVLEFYQLVGADLEEVRTRTHGHIDHITIDVLDVQAAMQEALQKGAALDPVVSPAGPVSAPAYWSKGVEYVFIDSPNGERIELNERKDLDPKRRLSNLGGWSHLGLPVTDIEKSKAFYKQFGFRTTMDISIPADGDHVRVAMLEKDGFTLEIYQLTGADLEQVRQRKDGFIDHFAMNVEDVEKAFGELREGGFNPLDEAPVSLPVGEHGVRYFFVRGPDGEKVEFNQQGR